MPLTIDTSRQPARALAYQGRVDALRMPQPMEGAAAGTMPQTATLLLIVSDAVLAETLLAYLHDEGYRVIHTTEGLEGLRAVRTTRPELIILDRALAGNAAIALCAMLRKESSSPLILLTSGVDEFEQIIGLDMGADLCM